MRTPLTRSALGPSGTFLASSPSTASVRSARAKRKPWACVTPEPFEFARLGWGFDPFCHHTGLEGAGERKDAFDDRRAIVKEQACHERAVDS